MTPVPVLPADLDAVLVALEESRKPTQTTARLGDSVCTACIRQSG